MQELDKLDANSIRGALEAMLLVSSDPVSATDLAAVLGITPGEASEALADLAAEYSDANRGFQLREVAGGWRLFTHPAYHGLVEALRPVSWDTHASSTQAALETLAVDRLPPARRRARACSAVRGVNSDGAISVAGRQGSGPRGWAGIREGGKPSCTGRPPAFLEKSRPRESLRELPDLEQFAPDEESRRSSSASA